MELIKKILMFFRVIWFCQKTGHHIDLSMRIYGRVRFRMSRKSIKMINFGKNLSLYNGVLFWGSGRFSFGDNVSIGDNTILFSSKDGGISIGSNSMIAANCFLIDSNHQTSLSAPIKEQPMIAKAIKISNDCWVCANCTLAPGAVMLTGTVLGANSFCSREIGPNGIYGGVPAVLIKERK